MIAGLENHCRGAQGRLRGEQGGDIPRQADFYAGFSQRFQDDVDVGGSTGGQSGYSIHVFFIDDDGATDNVEELTSRLHLGSVNEFAFAQRSHSNTKNAGSVRHRANHGNFRLQSFLNLAGMNRSCDRDDELLRGDIRADLLHHLVDDLRLHANEDDVGVFYGGEVVGG